jgi:hypothetical protein
MILRIQRQSHGDEEEPFHFREMRLIEKGK